MSEVKNDLDKLYDNGLVYNYTFDSYIPETERYGGIDAIKIAERFFYADSICIASIIKLYENNDTNLDKNEYMIFSLYKMLNDLNINYKDQLKLLDGVIDTSKYRKLFNENRKNYMQIVDNNSYEKYILSKNNGEKIIQYVNERSKILKEYSKEIENKSNKINIIRSLLHMNCNRFYGIDRQKEIIVTSLLRHSIQSIIGFKKSKGEL